MNIYQCQEKAKEMGYDTTKFKAKFPAGEMECTWLDAHMGLFEVDIEELRGGFLMVDQINEMCPGLVCSEPYTD